MPDHGESKAQALTHLAVTGFRYLQQLTLPLASLTLTSTPRAAVLAPH
jgi:hypothetical protein